MMTLFGNKSEIEALIHIFPTSVAAARPMQNMFYNNRRLEERQEGHEGQEVQKVQEVQEGREGHEGHEV